jgi:hypothetical protein
MTPAEFRKRLGQLQEVITRGLHYYAAWTNLLLREEGKVSWSLEEQNQVLGRFKGFFTPVGFALLHMAFIEFNKVFDTDPKAASLWNLLGAAGQDTSLVSDRTPADVAAVSRQSRQSRKMLTALKRRRNQQLAHVDADPAPVDPILKKDFDDLVEHVVSAFNWLSTTHDGRVISWEQSLQRVERDTSQILDMCVEQLRRQRSTAEDTRS